MKTKVIRKIQIINQNYLKKSQQLIYGLIKEQILPHSITIPSHIHNFHLCSTASQVNQLIRHMLLQLVSLQLNSSLYFKFDVPNFSFTNEFLLHACVSFRLFSNAFSYYTYSRSIMSPTNLYPGISNLGYSIQ